MTVLLLLFVISLVIAVSNSTEQLKNVNNLFTKSIYNDIAKTRQENFLISPFSIWTVFAFTQTGARGDCAKELQDALHLSQNETEVEYSSLSNLTSEKSYTFRTANKMYVEESFSVRNEFKKRFSEVYRAECENIDFGKSTEALATINSWVEEQTNKKIKDFLSADSVDETTRAIVVNALYFKGEWETHFTTRNTEKKKFYKTENETVEVDTLHHVKKWFKYYQCSHLGAQFLEMPFKGGDASMVIVLPDEKNGLQSVEKQLDKVFFREHELKLEYLNVALPKFKIENSIDFKKILQNLGVHKIFDRNEADLSGIAGQKGDLSVDKIEQKAFIDVNEGGVEAAAATFYEISGRRLIIGLPKAKDFVADHPFMFYIKIKGFIVFAGRVVDPSKS